MKTLTLAALLFCVQEKAPEGATTLDASQFVHEDGKPCTWPVADGVLEVGKGSIMTKEKYSDFQLHVEFNIPEPPEASTGQARSNSGVYLQRRYEVQILDSMGDDPPKNNGCASIYTQKAPDKNAGKKPGEWQTYDITFRAARFDAAGKKTEGGRITVIWNGVKVHDDYELKNKTGAGKPEGPEPGQILLQDHGAKVKFRNLWILPKK
jgi:3-keto-disaccharide hydrolase